MDTPRKLSASQFQGACRAFISTLGTALLASCVVIPLSSDRTALPTITSVVPEELRSSEGEVMVLTQIREVSRSLDVINAPVFARGNTLQSAVRRFDQKSTSRFFWGGFIPSPSGGVAGGGVERFGEQYLVRMCLVTLDGSLLTLEPSGAEWGARKRTHLYPARRDAIVSALRAGGETPFEKVDGPCGLSGKLDWSSSERTKTITFLAQVPATELGDMNARITAILERARSGEPQGAAAMLLYAANWEGEDFANPPFFLSRSDFEELEALTGHMEAREVAALLPVALPQYSSGRTALENVDVSLFCVMLADEGSRFWNENKDMWIFRKDPMEWQQAKQVILANLSSVEVLELDQDCIPSKLTSWTDSDFKRARAFLKLSVVASAQDWLREQMRFQDQSATGARTGVLLLVVSANPADVNVYPFFGDSRAEFRTLADVLLSLPPRAAFSVLDLEDPAYTHYLCVLGADAQYLSFFSTGQDATKWSISTVMPSTNMVTFRDQAISALREDKHGYNGAYVCSLEEARWPKETRARVSAFLENMKVASPTSN